MTPSFTVVAHSSVHHWASFPFSLASGGTRCTAPRWSWPTSGATIRTCVCGKRSTRSKRLSLSLSFLCFDRSCFSYEMHACPSLPLLSPGSLRNRNYELVWAGRCYLAVYLAGCYVRGSWFEERTPAVFSLFHLGAPRGISSPTTIPKKNVVLKIERRKSGVCGEVLNRWHA